MSIAIRIQPNPGLCLREPQDTKLGRKILRESILMIDNLGVEGFTFKKLATKIDSTEASVYRYFENKHLLLTYLVSWYWEWVSFQIDISTMNIDDPSRRLKLAIKALVRSSYDSHTVEYVNESALHRIVIAEGAKAYHTKDVDEENKKGFFVSYQNLVARIAKLIKAVNPDFEYSEALGSNLFEMANNQIFFAQHLPSLTNIKADEDEWEELEKMLEFFAFKMLSKD